MEKFLCRSFVLVIVTAVAAAAFLPGSAYADGKYFPEKTYKVAPAIPTQRAIVAYKDGTEKLTIESTLDGKGREFGWVIPLPSKPTEFKEVSPGLIKTLSLAVQPDIIHDLRQKTTWLWQAAIFVTLGCFIGVARKSPSSILLLILLVVIFFGVFMPSLGRRITKSAGLAEMPGIKVLDIQEIGSYELAVLEAENADAFNRWLEDNGFAGLTEDDRGIITDYISDGWCFVAAKLRRDKDGYSRPHPLSMSFAADAPVYPVRLTATTGSDVYLELFVIADGRGTCEKLALEVSDKYFLMKREVRHASQTETLPAFVGNKYLQEIGHPEIQEHMWDGCVLSKLCGTLKPAQMNEDLAIHLDSGGPCQKRYYSRQGATQTALMYSLWPWCALNVVLTAFFFRKAPDSARLFIFISRVVVPALLFSLMTWGLTYAILPKVKVKATPHRIFDLVQRKQRALEVSILAGEHGHFGGMNKDEIARLFEDYYTSKDSTNPYTGEPIKREDSPGNYTILEDDRGIVWRTYTMQGYPDDCILTSSVQN